MKTSGYEEMEKAVQERLESAFPKGVIRTVYGRKARFCSDGCRDGFREDRKHGLIYQAWEGPAEGTLISWEAASLAYGHCAYCRSGLR